MLFCDTPYQSIIIALTVGFASGALIENPLFGILIAGSLAFVLEILIHEFREDDQYLNAKQQFKELIYNM